ncbi:MAG TPA: hypothetical protein VJZ00_23200 [Thermoanaerobaculia bacterium]|nr:hypothetical protein [Thermoanaerobaculia bacterium]
MIWNRIAPFANLRTFLVLFALTLGFFTYFALTNPKMDALRRPPYFDRPNDKLAEFLRPELVDLVFPVVYSMMFAVAIVGLGKSLRVSHEFLLLPLFAWIADWTENGCTIAMICQQMRTQRVSPTLAAILAAATPVKFAMFFGSCAVVILFAILKGLKRT